LPSAAAFGRPAEHEPSRRLRRMLFRRCRRTGEGIVGDGKLELLEALDLVAEAGGLLELEVGGGIAHALLEIGNGCLEIVTDEGAFLGEAGADRDMVLLIARGEDVADRLAYALRRYAMLDIEGLLLLAPPICLGHRSFHRAGDLVGVEDYPAVDI